MDPLQSMMSRWQLSQTRHTTSCRSLMAPASSSSNSSRTATRRLEPSVRRAKTKKSIEESSTETEATASLSHSNSHHHHRPPPPPPPPGKTSSSSSQQQRVPQSPQQRPSLTGRRAVSSRALLQPSARQTSRRNVRNRGLNTSLSSSNMIARLWSSHSDLPLNKPKDYVGGRCHPRSPTTATNATGRRALFTQSKSVPALLAPKLPKGTCRNNNNRNKAEDDLVWQPKQVRRHNHIESTREMSLKQKGRRSRLVDAHCGYYKRRGGVDDDEHHQHHQHQHDDMLVHQNDGHNTHTIVQEESPTNQVTREKREEDNNNTKRTTTTTTMGKDMAKQNNHATATLSPPNMEMKTSPLEMVIEVPADFDGAGRRFLMRPSYSIL